LKQESNGNDQKVSPPELPKSLSKARALYDYTALTETELSFKQGDIILIIAKPDDFWWDGDLNGKVGYIPSNYVEEIRAPQGSKGSNSTSNNITTSVGTSTSSSEEPVPTPVRPPNSPWQQFVSKEGETYFYNVVTGDTSWEAPAGL